MKQKLTRSLNHEIKKAIGLRIVICSLILLAAMSCLTIIDMSSSLEQLRDQINHQVKPLEDFAIGEIMIDNPQAIAIKIRDFNQTQQTYHLSWIPYNQVPFEGVRYVPPFGWEYNYQLANIVGYHFGYFKVTGSLLFDQMFLFNLLGRILIFLLFIVALVFFLFPLAKRIPQRLFVNPINHLISLVSAEHYSTAQNTSDLPIEIKSLETEIISLLNSAKQRERDQALIRMSEMSRQVAHDLRNYLLGLNQWIENLPDESKAKKDKAYQYIKDIEVMSNNLLEKYKISSSTGVMPEEQSNCFSITDQIINATLLAEFKCKSAGIALDIHLPTSCYDVFVKLESSLFKRILINLINNAIEAEPKSQSIKLSLSANTSCIDIRISDDGKGIPIAIQQKLGKEEVTHNKHNGHGIGLLHAAKTIDSWSGTLAIDSVQGIGTTVIITLPISRTPRWFVPKLDLTEVHSVVIIDDDEQIHQCWEDRLSACKSCTIHHYYEPSMALAFIEQHQHDPHMLFLVDYQIGNHALTGIDIITQGAISNNAILVTGRSDEADITHICNQQGIKLLPKNNIKFISITKQTT